MDVVSEPARRARLREFEVGRMRHAPPPIIVREICEV